MRRAGVVAVCSALVLVGVLSAVTNSASASPKEKYKIYGWVIDGWTGEGIKDVEVELKIVPYVVNRTFTNDTGYFEMWVNKGSYSVEVYKAGYTINWTHVKVTNKDVCVNLTLLKQSTVWGYVRDAKTGKGVEGAEVVVFENVRWTFSPILLAILYRMHLVNLPIPPYLSRLGRTVTLDDGWYALGRNFLFNPMKPGTYYTLLVMKFGYIPETKVITFREYGEIKEVNFTLNRIIPI